MSIDAIVKAAEAEVEAANAKLKAAVAERTAARHAEIEAELGSLGFALQTPLNGPDFLCASHPTLGEVSARNGDAERLLTRAKSKAAANSALKDEHRKPVAIHRGAFAAGPTGDARDPRPAA